MNDKDQRLSQLQHIAGILADHALHPVVVAMTQVQRTEAQIAEIAHHRRKLTAFADDPSIAGTMLAQAERLRVKQAAALTELASAHVTLDKARRAAVQAVGRSHVLGAISEKRMAGAKLEARRRLLR